MLPGLRDEGPASVRDYLQILRRRKWLVLQALVLVPLAAVLWGQREPTVYRASAGVLMETQNLAANLEGIPDPTQANAPRVIRTQLALARVPEVARRTIEAAGLEEWGAADLLGISDVTSPDDDDILTFTVVHPDAALAVRVVNEYATQFTHYRRELDAAAITRAREAVRARLTSLETAGQQRSALYASLVESEQRLATLESLQTSRAVVVRPAARAQTLGPQPTRNAALGLTLGLFLGLGLALLREALDTRVRSTGAVSRQLSLPLLGRLPRPPRRIRRRNRLVMLAEPDGPHAEAFRMLVPSVELMNIEPQAKVIMITSAVEAEGKSTTAANLAVAFAVAGRRVALVDCDPYHPGVHRFFPLPASPERRLGLWGVLAGKTGLRESLVPIDVGPGRSWIRSLNGDRALEAGRLELLPSGSAAAPRGPTANVRFGEVLDELRSRSDLVLLDGPPLLRTADALVASSRVDALILVVGLHVIRTPMLEDLQRVLSSTPVTKLGFVATGADAESGYGYLAYPYVQRQPKASVEAGS